LRIDRNHRDGDLLVWISTLFDRSDAARFVSSRALSPRLAGHVAGDRATRIAPAQLSLWPCRRALPFG
jgi:hypothetical protein